MPNAIVAADGSGQYRTLQAAIDAAPQLSEGPRWIIMVKPGFYHELIYVQREKRFITLVGVDPLRTTVSYNLTAGSPGIDGRPIGTFRTPTAFIDADDFEVENITLENSAGPNGQALAVRVDGDRVVFRNCRFLGWQDTVFLNRGRHYFEDCYIAGHVDFIFGGATAFFSRCELHVWRDGFITAASTPSDAKFGFVFSRCRITNEDPEVRTYLGRPWRDYASVTILDTDMGTAVQPEGWQNWGRPHREKTSRYAEFGSFGTAGSLAKRVGWARTLTASDAAATTVEEVLGKPDNWNPEPHSCAPDSRAAIGRDDTFGVPGFTIEGVLRMAKKEFPQANVCRVSGELPSGVKANENVTYTTVHGQDLQLDIYCLNNSTRRPAVLLIHGGGWVAGDRTMERPLAKQLAARGYVAATVSYRLGPDGAYPHAIYDLKAAVRWMRAHAEEYGLDATRIGVVGGSAGGTLAAFLGASNGLAEVEGTGSNRDQSSQVQAVVCIDGAVSFLDNRLISASETVPSRFWVYVGGVYSQSRAVWQAASPLFYVHRGSAPTLFINSTAKQPILPGREEMAARLKALDIDSELIVIPNTPHVFWLVKPWFDVVLDETARFLDKHLRR